MRRFGVMAVLAPLCACAAWPNGSYVRMTNQGDGAVLAPAIAGYVSKAVPAGTVVTLMQPTGDAVLSPVLSVDLVRAGVKMGVAGIPVAYLVTPLDQGVLLRITVGRAVASRYLVRNTGGQLQPGGPMMVAQP
jgi:hypothetical protein